MSEPTVDVILPVYNCEPFIEEALESLLAQTYQYLQIYIIDDGSIDKTAQIVSTVAERDSRIRFIQNKKNRGIVDCLNKGIDLGQGKYIARMDGDDICNPDRIEKQLLFLEQHSGVVACSGSFTIIDEGGNVQRTVIATNKATDPFCIPAHQHFLLHPFLLVERVAMEKIGGYRRVTHCEDADLYYRLAAIGKLHNLTETLGKYRVHPASVSSLSIENAKTQTLNSQLCALAQRRQLLSSKPYQLSEKIIKNISVFTTSKNPTFQHLIRAAIREMELTNDETEWLYYAFPLKFFQEVHNRKLCISLQDHKSIIDIIGRPRNIHPRSIKAKIRLLRALQTQKNASPLPLLYKIKLLLVTMALRCCESTNRLFHRIL